MKGDRRALNRLLECCYPRVYALAFRYFADRDLALDVSQRCLMSVYQQLAKLKDPDKFKFWLYRTALNHCHMEERSRRRFNNRLQVMQERTYNDNPLRPDQIMARQERQNILSRALQQIPEEQRELILLKEYEGLKFREIADLLQISENTAKARLYYGLKKLRNILVKTDINCYE